MKNRVLIIGAGEAGRMLVREIGVQADAAYEIVGFLDDDVALHGTDVMGLPVLGACADLPQTARSVGVDEVIIAVPSAGREFVRAMIALCRDAGLPFRIVPGLLEIIKGPVRLEQLRDVHPEDLLGRESAEFDEPALAAALSGRRVLVTGAGGSIGGEICRQLGRFGPEKLFLLGRGENQIFDIEQEIRAAYPSLQAESIIADIRDGDALGRLFERLSPHYVYHAAAHKHVHFMESFPDEAVKNNIFGTHNVITASAQAGVERVVMLSTDKAVNPGGVMGASKRVAEYMMMGVDRGPKLITVRFGNVLGSRGSVVPLFMRQIQDGGPVTVSHQEASRFFMSLREACMLVVQASLMGSGGEIFILRMGEPIRIIEIAKDLIALHGHKPGVDVRIEIVGLRPGEKLHEDLVADGEDTVASQHPQILEARSHVPEGFDLDDTLAILRRLCHEGDNDGIRRYLAGIIPEATLKGS